MFPTLKMFGVGSIPWAPLAMGILTRQAVEGTTRGKSDFYLGMYKKFDAIVKR